MYEPIDCGGLAGRRHRICTAAEAQSISWSLAPDGRSDGSEVQLTIESRWFRCQMERENQIELTPGNSASPSAVSNVRNGSKADVSRSSAYGHERTCAGKGG